MVDFAASQNQFKAWRDDKNRREKLLSDLLDIIKSHVYRKFGSVVYNPAFSRLSKENQEEFRLNAYVLAARACVADVAIWKKRENMSHVPTAYVFEEGDIGVGKLSDRMLADGHAKPLFFAKKPRVSAEGTPIEAYSPLQAADLLAYEIYKVVRDVAKAGGPVNKFRWPLEQLESIQGVIGEFTTRDLAALNNALDGIRLKETDLTRSATSSTQ